MVKVTLKPLKLPLQVLEMSQVKLREAGYIPGMDFPEDELLREGQLCMCVSIYR